MIPSDLYLASIEPTYHCLNIGMFVLSGILMGDSV